MQNELIKIDKSQHIGTGGFANVYKYNDEMVIKVLKDEFKNHESVKHRFKREYNITKSLQDIDGIIEVYNYSENLFQHSYTMKFANSTLYDYVIENKLSDYEKRQIILKIVEVMKLVHDRNIIHRDLSPQNILMIGNDFVISDFGLGKDLEIFHSHRTVYTNSFGQYNYCAPEQFMKLCEGSKKSDVYSLGRLINFILTNDPLNKRHFLRCVCEKAHNINPNMRYENAGQFLINLNRMIENEENEEFKNEVLKSINKKIHNEDVNRFIYSLNAEEICKLFIENDNFVDSFLEFIKLSDELAEEYLTIINNTYSNVTYRFEDNDNFSILAYKILNGQYTFVAKEIAASILYYNAFLVNRYHAQHLIEDLLETGVEPLIEEKLKY